MDINRLAEATDDEMFSLLGLYAVPLMLEPDQSLMQGRLGIFSAATSESLGQEFHQAGFRELGQKFLHSWGREISRAICGDEELYKGLRERGLTQMGASVGLITACMTARIPELAPYSGLLTVLGAFIAQTGLNGFCKMLADDEVAAKSDA